MVLSHKKFNLIDSVLKVLNEEERQRLVNNIAGHLVNAQEFLQERAINNFTQVCPEYGAGVRNALNRIKASQTSSNVHAVTASNAKL